MQELANSILLSQSGVSRLVDRMERAGLVERTSCATDGRGTFAHLTTSGRDALRKAAPTHLRGIDEHFLSHLSRKETAALRSAMAKIVSANARIEAGLTQPGSSAPPARRPASRPRAPARKG
jgi:DNA-binding MarR family transcriptional regulator